MTDSIMYLYERLNGRYPYQPSSLGQTAQKEVRAAQQRIEELYPDCHELLFRLSESNSLLALDQSRHAFALGLDLGLSLAQEMKPFQEEH